MEQYKIDRINFLARKSRREELTSQLDNTYIVEKDGSKHKVTRKNGGNHNE